MTTNLYGDEVLCETQAMAGLHDIPVAPMRIPPNEVLRNDFMTRHSSNKLLTPKISPGFRYIMGEVFKFLPISSIETTVARVNKSWFKVSRDDELWKSKCIEDFSHERTLSQTKYRAEYLDRHIGSCWHCGKYVEHFGIVCKPLRRLMCVVCSQLSDCRIVPIKSLIRQFCIQKSTLSMLKVPIFIHNGTLSTYTSLLTQKVCPYYERRRDMLMQMLPKGVSKSTLKKLQQFDFSTVSARSDCIAPKCILALLYFCGRNQETESLADSFKVFADHPSQES